MCNVPLVEAIMTGQAVGANFTVKSSSMFVASKSQRSTSGGIEGCYCSSRMRIPGNDG